MNKYQEKLKHHCKNVPFRNFDYAINISLKYKYIFAETPKVACSGIKTILQKIEMNNPKLYWENFEDIHNRELSPLKKPSEVENFDLLIKDKNYFKFCFVRNPYDRLLSAYLDKIIRGRPQKRAILLHLGKDKDNLNQYISFEEFVTAVCEQDILKMNPHWRIQYYQTFQDTIKYDFIGKLENYNKDIQYVLSKIVNNFSQYISDERRHATKANTLINKYYTPKIIKMVQKKYAIDFEYFKYSINL